MFCFYFPDTQVKGKENIITFNVCFTHCCYFANLRAQRKTGKNMIRLNIFFVVCYYFANL